jgi:hypothetical protein
VRAARLVALGASNLTRGFATVVETARSLWGGPVEVLAALGHGRSYGLRSLLLGRRLPSILECGLWRDLESRPPAPTRAVVSDVGNDILYGASVPQILEWVEACVERLERAGARVLLTDLPLASIRRLGEPRYLLFRSVLVPSCRLSLREARERAERLAEGLEALAARRNHAFFRLKAEWYGWDPIHVRPALWSAAWREILLATGDAPSARETQRAPLLRGLGLYLLAPERRWLFGFEQRRAQPAATLEGGTTLWMY